MTTPNPHSSGLAASAATRLFAAWAGLAFGLVAIAWLLPGLDGVGLTWDEPRYFTSVIKIQDWVAGVVTGPDRAELLSEPVIRETWDWARYWNPHPPAYKAAMAATEALFGGWLGAIAGFRMASLLFFSGLVGVVAWLAGITWGRVAGVGAGLSVLLMPRLVGHAHIGATDMPLAMAWLIASSGLALFVLGGRRWNLVLGAAALGFALATKFTGWLLPVSMVLWLALFGRSRRGLLGSLVWGIGGLFVAWALNPLAWHHPLGETFRMISESLHREDLVPISTYYMGRTWGYQVPAHHALVMTLITTPLPLLVLGTAGLARSVRWLPREPVGMLAVLQVLFFLTLMAAPSSPNHDGVRLFLPMFPFLALLAGSGFGWMVRRLDRMLPERYVLLAGLAAGSVFFLPPYVQTVRVAPLYLSYYNEAIGGLKGAAAAGMEVTYWLDALTPSFLEQVNEVVPDGSTITAFPNPEHLVFLQDYGLLKKEIRVTGGLPADYLVLSARKATFSVPQWNIYLNSRPELAVELDGVELAGLYRWAGDASSEPDPEEP